MVLLEKFLFYLLVFCLPFQTRKILAVYGGGFNEWSSVYLYFTDLLLLALLFLWLRRERKNRFLKDLSGKWLEKKIKGIGGWLVLFLIIALLSLAEASNFVLGLYQWIKLLELALFFFYLKANFGRLFGFFRLSQALFLGGLFQSVIALGQFFNQRSLGLKILAESPLDPSINGVAKIETAGIELIRAYGALPHPNMLAVFLFLSIFAFYLFWLEKDRSFPVNLLLVACLGIMISALYLTFSRSVIIIFWLASIFYFSFVLLKAIQSSDKGFFKRTIGLILVWLSYVLLALFLLWPEINARFSLSLSEQALVLRESYQSISFFLINQSPLLGIGIGNFVWKIRGVFDLMVQWFHQPVHNLYLLVAVETGIVGLIAFLFFLWRSFLAGARTKRFLIRGWLIALGGGVVLLGMTDHFFWTLQQGQLIFWLVWGLAVSQTKR